MKFICSLIVVDDIEVSKSFYQTVLKQEVKFDFGENVLFEGGFAIHLKSHFAELINVTPSDIIEKSNNFELYFEEDDLDGLLDRLKDTNSVEYIHEIEEQPWGQRVVRFYDPDMHIIEVGESLECTARRLLSQGMTVEETAARLSMPIEFVKQCLSK